MNQRKRSVVRILLALLIAGFVPKAMFAQSTYLCETSGLMTTTLAGTVNEQSFRFEGYSGFYIGQMLSTDIGNVINSFISSMGASLLYGLSRNTEMGLNIQSFDNIISDGSINLPEIHLNCKVNLLPAYESTGLGFVIQLLNFSGNTLTTATDLYIMGTTVIKEAVGLSLQMGLIRNDFRFAIYTSPRESTSLMVETVYLPGSGSLIFFPGIKFGSSEKGFQLKLSTMLDVAEISIDQLVLFIKAGIGF